jgi:hypothetical protein
LDQLIDLADYDHDGLVNYAEFARLITAEDVINMKDTLSGGRDERNTKTVGPRRSTSTFRPDASAAELRYAQQNISSRLLVKYKRITDPFKRMDQKRTGALPPLLLPTWTHPPDPPSPPNCASLPCMDAARCLSIDKWRGMRSRAETRNCKRAQH